MAEEDTIDYMTMDDLPEVLAVERMSFADPWPEEVFKAELRHCWSHCRVLRRREDGHIIGYLVFWSVADEVHLLNIAVEPSERHHQHGRALVDYMLQFAREHHARFVTLEVRRSNEAAVHLYEGCGFKQVGVRPQYYANDGEDAIVMLYDLGSQSQVTPIPGTAEV
ncbi:MAG: ribosomal protein S18-alanine N-acetyltransferase [Myxococcota bacterium]